MQKEPLVSAVIITYNQEKYIKQTIDCALAQKVDFPYEIVIGEDCSTDGTREICQHYQERYPEIVRVITSDKNVGLMDNYYRTVKATRGKYIAICGGDDYWHNPEKIQKQMNFFEKNPEYGMVHSDADFFYQTRGQFIRNYHSAHGYECENLAEGILEHIHTGKYLIVSSTVVFKRELFDRYFNVEEYRQKGFMMEDTPLWTAIAAHSKIYYLDESLAVYRLLEESMTQSKNKIKKLQYWISASEMHIDLCEKYKLPLYVKDKHVARCRRMSLQLAFLTKQCDLANKVKKKYPNLSLKDWMWYWGTKNLLIRQIVLLLQTMFEKTTKIY